MLRVAVIGAGVSGASCARHLVDAGVGVVVLEKSRGAGGRSSTRRRSGYSFDHGAQYFTVEDAEFERMIDGLRRYGLIGQWPGRLVELEGGVGRPLKGNVARWVGVPGMSVLARRMLNGIEFGKGRRVERLALKSRSWYLDDATGARSGPFDAVIVATPAPQAAALASEVTSLSEPVAAVEMSPCWAGMFAFSTSNPVAFDAAFVRGGPLAWVARNSSKPARSLQPDAWVVHATTEWSAEHLGWSEEDVGPLLLDAFREALGQDPGSPIHLDAHGWRYAFPAAHPVGAGSGVSSGETSDHGYLYDSDRRIGFCGDWLTGGGIESAVLSGLGLAERILYELRSTE